MAKSNITILDIIAHIFYMFMLIPPHSDNYKRVKIYHDRLQYFTIHLMSVNITQTLSYPTQVLGES